MSEPLLHLTRSSHLMDDHLSLGVIRRKPQEPFPLHTHDFSELVIVLSGTGTHFTQTDEYTVAAGDAFVIEGKNSHGYRNIKGLELVNILFDPVQLGVPSDELGAIPGYRTLTSSVPRHRRNGGVRRKLKLGPGELEHAEELVASLEREFREKRLGYHSLSAAYFLQIVGFLARCFGRTEEDPARPIFRLSDAKSYLEENLNRHISITELVTVSRTSQSTLLRSFKKVLGMSPTRYHLHLRIERACALLARQELSITEVSYRCGFSDSNYFSRQFRRMKACSPREFRRAATADASRSFQAAGNA